MAEFHSPYTLSKRLGFDVRTINQWIEKGKVKVIKQKSSYVVDPDSAKELISFYSTHQSLLDFSKKTGVTQKTIRDILRFKLGMRSKLDYSGAEYLSESQTGILHRWLDTFKRLEDSAYPLAQAIRNSGLTRADFAKMFSLHDYPLHSIDKITYIPRPLIDKLSDKISEHSDKKALIQDDQISKIFEDFKHSKEFKEFSSLHQTLISIKHEGALESSISAEQIRDMDKDLEDEFDSRSSLRAKPIEDLNKLISKSKDFNEFYNDLSEKNKQILHPALNTINLRVDNFNQLKCINNLHKIILTHYDGKVPATSKLVRLLEHSNNELEITSLLNNYVHPRFGSLIHKIVTNSDKTQINSIMDEFRRYSI